jgi:hypothetical protein
MCFELDIALRKANELLHSKITEYKADDLNGTITQIEDKIALLRQCSNDVLLFRQINLLKMKEGEYFNLWMAFKRDRANIKLEKVVNLQDK